YIKRAFYRGLRIEDRRLKIKGRIVCSILDPRPSPQSVIRGGGERTAKRFAASPLQMAKVLFRIVESVNMVDAQAGNVAFFYQAEDQCVNRGEDFGLLDANGGQFVDVEEAAVVDLVRRHAPET